MDDDAIKQLRALAEWATHDAAAAHLLQFAARDILALLDEREALKERLSDTRAKEQRALREAMEAVRERDAAMALLRQARERVEDYDALLHDTGGSRELALVLLNDIDALLGDGPRDALKEGGEC